MIVSKKLSFRESLHSFAARSRALGRAITFVGCAVPIFFIDLGVGNSSLLAATPIRQETSETDKANQLRDEINAAYAEDLKKTPEAASRDFQNILDRYIEPGMDFRDGAKILKEAGFSLTVFGQGAYAFPDVGVPSRGSKVTAILNISGGLLHGADVSVDIYPSEIDQFDRIKVISVHFFNTTP